MGRPAAPPYGHAQHRGVQRSAGRGLGLLLLTGHAQVWHFGALAMASAVGKAFFRPATAGLVSELVPPRQLQSANALLSLCRSVPAVAGPAVAGLLVALAGPGWAYVIDGASFLFSALLLATIPVGRREPKERDSFWSELRGGAAEVTGRPWLWQNLLSHGLWNLGFSMLFVLGPTLVMVETSGSAAGTGAAGWAAVSTGLTVGGLAAACSPCESAAVGLWWSPTWPWPPAPHRSWRCWPTPRSGPSWWRRRSPRRAPTCSARCGTPPSSSWCRRKRCPG
ncbi:MFS transporter [Kitasatospora gansuensis]